MLLPLVLAACTGGEESPAVPEGRLVSSWVAEVARDPASFTALVDTDRPAWIALHRNDWKAALESTAVPGVRARAQLARFHGILAQTETLAARRLDEAWQANGGPPADSAWPLVAYAAALQAGDPTWTQAAQARVPPAAQPVLAALGQPAGGPEHPLVARKRQHAAVIAGAEPLPGLLDALATPVVSERVGSATREFWDPWAHHTLAAWYTQLPSGTPPPAPIPGDLGDRLFSATLLPGVLDTSTFAALGIPPVPPEHDDAQACRESVRAFDAQLDAWALSATAGLPEDGRALLSDLRLVPVARARVLEALAVEALPTAPNCALAYVLLAQDHADARAINPVNSPTLFAVLATAQLATGHTREALDALEPLASAFPEIHGLDETVGDLAILQGIHRTGDSREN